MCVLRCLNILTKFFPNNSKQSIENRSDDEEDDKNISGIPSSVLIFQKMNNISNVLESPKILFSLIYI